MQTFSKVFVYLRFSSEAQASGHSFTRQRQLATAYLTKMKISQEKVEWVEDPAVSAFHGDHVRNGELGKLLARVRDKSITNALLIFESVDRASRQGSVVFIAMLHEFLQAGFSVAFLDQPDEPFNIKSPPPFFGTYLSIRADIARMESQRKCDLSTKNLEKRRAAARESKAPITKECPRWLRVVEGKYEVDDARTESINKVFQLAKNGWGISKIVHFANSSKLPVPATGSKWQGSLLNRLFRNRALIGEFQPHSGTKSRRAPIGEPIRDYYPIVVDPELFYQVRALRETASSFPNKKDENNFNYLQGLGRCECGGTWRRLNKNSGKQIGYAQYSCSNRQLAVSQCKNLPSKVFDYSFIGAACARIPELLQVVDSAYAAKEKVLEQQLVEARRKLQKIIDLYQVSDDLIEELKPRVLAIGDEIKRLTSSQNAHRAEYSAQNAFDFGDAVTAYLPAFLDQYPTESDEGRNAFRLRALFRARILESVESVTINQNREEMTVRLKNSVEFIVPIEDAKFTTTSDYTEDEVAEMLSERETSIRKLFGE